MSLKKAARRMWEVSHSIQPKGTADDESADAEQYCSGYCAPNLSRPRGTCFSDSSSDRNFCDYSSDRDSSYYSTQESDPCGTKDDGVFIYHSEEGHDAFMIQQRLVERCPGLKVKLYGDVQSSGLYDCLERVCDHSKTIVVLWTPKFEDDEQCMDITRSLKAHKSFTYVSDIIFITYGFCGSRKPTKKCITLNDAIPITFSDDVYFYTSLENRLLCPVSRRAGRAEEAALKRSDRPSPMVRPCTTFGHVDGTRNHFTGGKVPFDVTPDNITERDVSFMAMAGFYQAVGRTALRDPIYSYRNTEDGPLTQRGFITTAVIRNRSHSNESEPQESCGKRVPDVRSGKRQPLTLFGTEEAKEHNTARSPLALHQTDGGAGKAADTGFCAVPPQPGEDSGQDNPSRQGTTPLAEGGQKEVPQSAQRNTEAAPDAPHSVQDGASKEISSTSLDAAPVSSGLQRDASKSQKASSDSENVTFVYNNNLDHLATNPAVKIQSINSFLKTLATQEDCDAVTRGRQHSPSVVSTTDRENQLEESGNSTFSQTKDVSPNYVLKNARGSFKTTHQGSGQEVRSSYQNVDEVDRDQRNIQARGARHVHKETADEDGALIYETSWSEKTELKQSFSLEEESFHCDVKTERKCDMPLTQRCDADINTSFEQISQVFSNSTIAKIDRKKDDSMPTVAMDTHHSENRSFSCLDDDSLILSLLNKSFQYDIKAVAILVKAAANNDQPQELCSVAATADRNRTSTDSGSISLSGAGGGTGLEVPPSSESEGSCSEAQARNQTQVKEGDVEASPVLPGPLLPPPHSTLPHNTWPFKNYVQVSGAFENQSDDVSYRTLFPHVQPGDRQSAIVVTQSTMTSPPASSLSDHIASNMGVFNTAHSEHLCLGTGNSSRTGPRIGQGSPQSPAALHGSNTASTRSRDGRREDTSEADLQPDVEKTPFPKS